MKKLVLLLAIGLTMVSCDFSKKDEVKTVKDSTVVTTDSVEVTTDTTKVDTAKTVETKVTEVKK